MAVAGKTTGVDKKEKSSARQSTGKVKTSVGKSKGRTKTSGRSNGRKSAEERRKNLDTINEYRDYQAFETGITIAVVSIVSLLLYLSYFSLAGKAGMVIGGLMFGLFGWFAWFLPLSVLTGYVFIQINTGDKRIVRKTAGVLGIILSLLALTDLIFNNDTIYEYYKINHVTHKGYFDAMFLACKNVMEWGKFNGGLLGRAFGAVFSVILGRVGATLLLFALLGFFVYIFYGIEALAKIRKRNAYRQEMGEIYEQVKEDEAYREPSYRVFTFRENKNRVQKPMRTLEKVPKVQSFDLRGQAEFFREEEKEKKSAFETENEKYFSKTEMKEDSGRKVSAGEKSRTEAETEKISDSENRIVVQRAENAEKEASEKEKRRDEIADLPIYRNELEKKFGNKKEVSLISSDQIVKEENGFGIRESAFERFEKRKEEMSVENFGEPERREAFDSFAESEEERVSDFSVGMKENRVSDYSEETKEANISDYSEGIGEESAFERSGELEEKIVADRSGKLEEESVFERSGELEEEIVSDRFGELEKESVFDDFEEPAGGLESGYGPDEPEALMDVSAAGEEDAVMILDDFIPQKPMASYAPKEEIDRIVIDGGGKISAGAGSQSISDREERPVGKHQEANNGSRVFSDLSSLSNPASDGQALKKKEIPEEKKIEKPYEFPKPDLLSLPKKSVGAASDDELRQTAAKLQETLESFNVKVKMGAVTCGPTVTRYELLPEQGVRVNKITNLADDLKLSLAAPSIRIEAPIPGKAAVGIEVPNAEASPVSFRELLEGEQFEKSKSPLTFAVGKDIAGKLIMADIAKMPHLLIAGATGSGKSVCINTLIMSILYKADPKDVKLIMIDPKVVELSCYNGIPHLFCPVVTDPKEAAASLNWAVREMMDRYNKFKELNVRNITGYNEKIKTVENAADAGYEKMPYLVVIVDEFADLMMVASKDVEDAVCRLAQLARAAGIHLVLATQRPSVNVITGVIKANIPSRIAFSVSSTIDSRTILDKGGAEKLLGKGDMLFFPSGYTEPVRVQGAFISDKEVNDVVEFLCDTNDSPEYNHAVTEIVEESQEEVVTEKRTQSDRDEYFADAGRFVIESERAAAGQLQRHFSIGFNRAGRIIDQLEKAGVVGPAAGTKPRNVLMTLEEFEIMLNGGDASAELMA